MDNKEDPSSLYEIKRILEAVNFHNLYDVIGCKDIS